MQLNIDAKFFGKYDVVVCGGGTAGVSAAIAAARGGAKTIIVERSFTVGGMLTAGHAGITKFTEHCKDVNKYKSEVLDALKSNPREVQVVGGIAKEYVLSLLNENTALGTDGEAGSYIFTDPIKARLKLMKMLDDAGVEVLYDTRICSVVKDENRITSIVVCNKEGFLHIDAQYFIDCTGDADVAYMSGDPCHKGASQRDVDEGSAETTGQMQHMGTMYRVRGVDFEKLFCWLFENPERFHQHEFGVMSLDNVRKSYENGMISVFRVIADTPDFGMFPFQVYNLPEKDEAIILGIYNGVYNNDGLNSRELSKAQHTLFESTEKMNDCIRKVPGFENVKTLCVPDVGVRETRHLDGQYVLSAMDVLSGKEFEDSIGCGGHPVDISPIPPEIEEMDFNHWRFYIPYRIMLPLKTENLLVAGRCVSATRIAAGAIRTTAQCMVMGEAAGTAAAMCVKDKTSFAEADIKKLRTTLKNNGAIL